MKLNASIWGISILLGIFVLVGSAVGIIELSGNMAIACEKAKLKARHMPTSIAEITPPEIPDKENAAVELMDAFDRLDKYIDKPILDPLEHLGTKDEIEKLVGDKYLTEVQKIAQKASEKPRCRWDLKYSDLNSLLIGHLSEFRNLVRLLCLRGMLEAKTGKVHLTYKTYITALRISSFLKEPPSFLINYLVKVACDSIIIKCIQKTLREYGISTEDAEVLLIELKRYDSLKQAKLAMEGERVFSMITFEERIAKGFFDRFEKSSGDPSLLVKQDYATFMKVFAQSEKWFSMPFWKIPGAPDGEKMDKELLRGIPEYYTITRAYGIWSSCRAKAAKMVRDLAKCKLTLLLYIYKNKNGHFPVTLSELNPEDTKGLLIDAVTGKKFIYKFKDNQIYID